MWKRKRSPSFAGENDRLKRLLEEIEPRRDQLQLISSSCTPSYAPPLVDCIPTASGTMMEMEVAGWGINTSQYTHKEYINPDTGEIAYDQNDDICGIGSRTIPSPVTALIACIWIPFDPNRDSPPGPLGEKEFGIIYEDGEQIEIGKNLDVNGASWSPDGRILVFDVLQSGETDIRELFFIESDNPEVIKQLTFDKQWNCCPSFSPAGDLIVYRIGRKGQHPGNLRVIRVSTSTNVQATSWGKIKRSISPSVSYPD